MHQEKWDFLESTNLGVVKIPKPIYPRGGRWFLVYTKLKMNKVSSLIQTKGQFWSRFLTLGFGCDVGWLVD